MKIKNVSTQRLSIGDIEVDGVRGLTLLPNQEATIYDEDAEKSKDLVHFLKTGVLTRVGDAEPGDVPGVPIEKSDKIIEWILAGDVAIQFSSPINGDIQNTYSGTHAVPLSINLVITNGVGVTDLFNSTATVVVSADAGTINGTAGSVTISFADGLATILVNRTDAGVVNLSLSGGNTTLNVSDTAQVTFA